MKAEMQVNSEGPTVAATAMSLPVVRPGRRASFVKLLTQCALVGLLAYASFFLVTHFVLQSVQVVGNSMAPTLQNTGRYLLNRWVYLVREPKPEDIVVLRDPADDSYAVKRIIARGGDLICLKSGRVYVNGHELNEPYLSPGTATFAGPNAPEQRIVCGKDQYFVLGDNRNNSADSRVYGPVSRQKILGMIIH